MAPKSFIYSPVKRGGLLRRKIVTYTEEEKDLIGSYFPPRGRRWAIKTTSQHVSELITHLVSPLIPQNIKRKSNIEELEEIQKHSSALYEVLKVHCQTPSHSSTLAFKAALYKYINPKHSKIHLPQLTDLMKHTKYACEDALKSYEIPGWKDQHYVTAIKGLANVWIKYNKKAPTRHSKMIEFSPGVIGQKESGPFIEYLEASILPILPRYNIEKHPSFPYLVKEIMENISQN